jgi:beta-galactosidase
MRLGVCYYPEHWPEAWWAGDAQAMAAMGIAQVRIGEFSWARIEPAPGQFDWGWLDRAIAILAAAGLKIVLCTPTTTPPKWLVDADPTMLAVGDDGHPRRFGSRRHYCFSSDSYLEQAERITRLFAERYGQHPAVVAWQTDNEFGCHDTVVSYSPNAVRRFRLWLEARYGTIERLNEAWGNVFWSMEYLDFEAIDAPFGAVTELNPAHRLDFRRFASDEVVRFNHAQCRILRQLSPGRPILHNFMLLFTEFDHYRVAADLDAVAWDSYPLGALENFWFAPEEKHSWLRTGHPDFAPFHHDLYRGMSRLPFWVMEQQPGPVNWARWNPAPAPGMVRLWTWEAFAHGADVVSYFRWRQAPFGQEQMHAGLYAPDRELAQGGREAALVARELAQVPACAMVAARTVLVFDYEARWLIQVQPQGADFDYLRQAFEIYSALRGQGLDVDILGSRDPDLAAKLAQAALVVVPSLPAAPPELVAALQGCPAQVVLFPRCGSKEESVRIPEGLPPGPFRRLVDIRVAGVESLRPGVREPVAFAGFMGESQGWRESLEPGPAVQVEARFDDGSPALVRQERVRYLGGGFDPASTSRILAQAAREAGLAPEPLPEGLRLRRRGDLLFVLNYSDQPRSLTLPAAHWLLGGSEVAPHGVAIARTQEVPSA